MCGRACLPAWLPICLHACVSTRACQYAAWRRCGVEVIMNDSAASSHRTGVSLGRKITIRRMNTRTYKHTHKLSTFPVFLCGSHHKWGEMFTRVGRWQCRSASRAAAPSPPALLPKKANPIWKDPRAVPLHGPHFIISTCSPWPGEGREKMTTDLPQDQFVCKSERKRRAIDWLNNSHFQIGGCQGMLAWQPVERSQWRG